MGMVTISPHAHSTTPPRDSPWDRQKQASDVTRQLLRTTTLSLEGVQSWKVLRVEQHALCASLADAEWGNIPRPM